MHDVSPLLISKGMTKSLSRLSSSKPLGLQRNSPKNILDPTKSLPSLVLYCLLSIFQSPCALFIQSSMCSCLNLLHPTLSPMLWQPLITKTNNHTSSKSLKLDIKWEFYKRTRQGVSAKLESYIY